MNHFFKAIFLVALISFSPVSTWASSSQDVHEERNYFQFIIPKYETKRQGGQIVTIHVRFAYKKGLPDAEYVDYRVMRQAVLRYMEPSDEYPINVYWEILATTMGRDLMEHYPLDGVSVQLVVLDNQNPGTYEPGDHGPVFTIGDIAPLDVH